jgi:uncharacterized membrane protein
MTSIVVGLLGIMVAVISGGAMYRSGRISRRGHYGVIGVMTFVFLLILALVIHNARNP